MNPNAPAPQPVAIDLDWKDTAHGRRIGGSDRDRFNNAVLNQAIEGQRPVGADASVRDKQDRGEFVAIGMAAFAPRDAIEGLMAAQGMALHAMAMECARKAQLDNQPHEIAQGLRKSAISASRMFAEIVDALDRKRGKHRRQVVRVERVTVEAGAQAVVGMVNTGGRGIAGGTGTEGQTQADMAAGDSVGALLPPVRSADPQGHPLPRARDGQRPVSDARRRQHRPPHS